MLSVKKKHPLVGNCDSRRRNCSRCTNLRQLLASKETSSGAFLGRGLN
jgi:hypothetical protein